MIQYIRWRKSQKMQRLKRLASQKLSPHESQNKQRGRRSWKLSIVITCAIYWRQITVWRGCWPPVWIAHILFYGYFFILFVLRWKFWLWGAIFPSLTTESCDVTCTTFIIYAKVTYSQTLLSSPGKACFLSEGSPIFFGPMISSWLHFYSRKFYLSQLIA